MRFRKETSDEISSVLGDGVEMTGELSFACGLRVDGCIKGKIRSEATLEIGPSGRVEAEVNIRKISINGEFRGVIHATDRVEIHREGKVYGDLYTPCLIIDAGAVFEGKCNMADCKTAKPGEAEKPVERVEPLKTALGAGEKTWQK
jgi:cytoskeletal protein CcmA (bactofilin family)